MSSTSQNPEVFVVRDELGPILYAPLSRSMARLNESAAQTALRYSENNQLILDVDEQAVIDSLAAHKFFEAAHTPRNDIEFAPVQVTLFPTNRCNLRCTYCYADGGEGGGEREPITTLDIDAGKAAIDLVAKNAIELSKTDYPITNFLVSFHGNGEPFSAFDTLKELVYYAVDVSESVDFPVVLNVATNGVLTVEQLDFLLAYFSNVNISFDGLPDVQNVQRPLSDGGESFSRVDNTLRRLNDSTVEFGIRATITDKTIGRISEMAHFVYDNYPRCQQLHLEPVWECGRCLKTQTETPEVDQFINQYLKAIGEQGNDGLRLTYSGARQDILTDAFCKVSSGGFTVTPTGDVT